MNGMKGLVHPSHCEKLPIPAVKPGEAAAMLSGQIQGSSIVSRLFPLLPHKEPTSYPIAGMAQEGDTHSLASLTLAAFPRLCQPHPCSP